MALALRIYGIIAAAQGYGEIDLSTLSNDERECMKRYTKKLSS